MSTTYSAGAILHDGRTPGLEWMRGFPASFTAARVGIVDDFVGVALDTNLWTVVKDTGATVAPVASALGGRLALTSTATTEDDGASIQSSAIFGVSGNNVVSFRTRIRVSDADEADLAVGLGVPFATNPEAMIATANRIVFRVADGDPSILCKTVSASVETSTDSGVDLVDNTFIDLAFVASASAVRFYVNGALVATHTTNISVTAMALACMSLSGSASGTLATTLDFIGAWSTR